MLHVFLSAAPAWSLLASFPPPPLKFTNWPIPQCYYWISKSREGAYITSPFVTLLPSFTLILSFIFLLFNNSLSALWPLIKMNSLCCRLLPPVSVISFSLALYWPSPPSPHLTYPSSLHFPWCPLYLPYHPSVHPLCPSLPSCLLSFPLPSLFSFNFSPSDTTVHHVPGSGHRPPLIRFYSSGLWKAEITLSSPPLAAATYCAIHHTWRMINTQALPLCPFLIPCSFLSSHFPLPPPPPPSPLHYISFFCLALYSPDLCEKTELVSPF